MDFLTRSLRDSEEDSGFEWKDVEWEEIRKGFWIGLIVGVVGFILYIMLLKDVSEISNYLNVFFSRFAFFYLIFLLIL